MIPAQAVLLRLYLNSSDSWGGRPLYRAIVETARASHLAGATVFPVEAGYGTHRVLHDARSEYASANLPLVVELVDAPERIEALLAEVGSAIREGLATTQPVRVVRYGPPAGPPPERRPDPGRPPQKEDPAMPNEGQAQRVTIYVGSSDTWHGRNLALEIVERCQALGLAGATMMRGILGFGKHSRLHRAHFLGLSEDLPERIEVVDRRADRIAALLPVLDELVGGGLVVIEDVRVIHYRHDPKSGSG